MAADYSSFLKISRSSYGLAAAAYMGLIYFLSSLYIPMDDVPHPNLISFAANLFHLPLYMGLAMVLLLALRSNKNEGALFPRVTVRNSIFILALYGAFDEYHQSWSGRTPSVLDWLVDICAGAAAVWTLQFLLEKSLAARTLFFRATAVVVLSCALAFAGMF